MAVLRLHGSLTVLIHPLFMSSCRIFAKKVDLEMLAVSLLESSIKSPLQQQGFLFTQFCQNLKKPRKWRTA